VILLAASGLSISPAVAAGGSTDATSLPGLSSEFNGVACPTTSFCLAVGGGTGNPVSAAWNGTRWRLLATPGPAGAILQGVACASPSNCLGVGYQTVIGNTLPFTASWDGLAWHLLPPIRALPTMLLFGVACPTASQCIAIGYGSTQSGPNQAVAVSWDGKSWTALSPVLPGNSAIFYGISCASMTFCMAVGTYETGQGFGLVDQGLAETWNGSAWTQVTVPANSVDVRRVSCPDTTTCLATGGFGDLGESPLAAVWQSTGWTTLPQPSPPAATGAVSCVSATWCMTVGGLSRGTSFASVWTGGTSWRVQTMSSPARLAISCASTRACMAAGGANAITLEGTVPFAASWNGSTWTPQRAEQEDALWAVSCFGRSACLSVGGFVGRAGISQPMTQSWNGARWRLAGPAHFFLGPRSALSCVGRSFCLVASGVGTNRWTGSRWLRMPRPPTEIVALSCATRTFCMGAPTDGPSLLWNGSTWREHHFSSPFDLTGLSCTRPSWCLAVGGRNPNGPPRYSPAAEAWNGSRWRVLRVPSLGSTSTFNDVSCVRGQGCMAIGNADDAGRYSPNFAARWNGRKWRLLQVPGGAGIGPPGTGSLIGTSGPTSVSCTSAGQCVAVGNYLDQLTGRGVDITVVWNGRSWRATGSPGPGGGLSTVSCRSAAFCMAVGEAGLLVLAERWNGRRWFRLRAVNP